jgi:hypothetical protein
MLYCIPEVIPMDSTQLQIGERVALKEAHLGLPAGTRGTIVHVYDRAKAYYAVQFDRARVPVPAHRQQLIAQAKTRELAVADAQSYR